MARKLKIDFEGITKQIEHNGVIGSAREDLLKDDFIPLCKMQAKIAKVPRYDKVTIYGYGFSPDEFSKFENYALNYDIYQESKENFDNIVKNIYSRYKMGYKRRK